MKYIKVKKNYGGGGGTTISSIPKEFIPAIQQVGNEAREQYSSGALSQVAGRSDLQNEAFGTGARNIMDTTSGGIDTLQNQAERLTNMATTPSQDVLNATKQGILLDAQKKVGGLNTNFGNAGTLGSARQAVMQGAQNAETTGALAKVDADYENKMFQNRLEAEKTLQNSAAGASKIAESGASSLANLGNQERGIDQQQLDSAWQGLQRYASTIYGNPARQSAAGGK